MNTHRFYRAGLGVAAAVISFAGAGSAAVRVVFPTGTTADAAAVQAVVDAANPGDTIVLKARTAGGLMKAFNFSAEPSGGITVNVANLNITGEVVNRRQRLATKLIGPRAFDPNRSMIAFDVNANNLGIQIIQFERFEAAAVLEQGVTGFDLTLCTVKNCANGVFGAGDNDFLGVDRVRFELVATPLGGNAGVTVQEGSESVSVTHCVFLGPGTDRSPLAIAGVIDFNLLAAGSDFGVSDSTFRGFDYGIYVSSSRSRIVSNLSLFCVDGIAFVSEIGTGDVQGTQLCDNSFVIGNRADRNADSGVMLVGSSANFVMHNDLDPNTGAGVSCLDSSLGTPCTDNTFTANSGTNDCVGGLGFAGGSPRRADVPGVHPLRP